MSSTSDLRTGRSLELLGQLHRTISEFARQEELLVRDIRTRRHTINRRLQDGTGRIDMRVEDQVAQTETSYLNEKDRINARHEARRVRIQQMQSAALRKLPARARAAKEKWMGDLQMEHFQAERELAAGLQAADQAFAAFGQKLAEQQSAITQLTHRAQALLSGYPSYGRILAEVRPGEAPANDPVDRDALAEAFHRQLAAAGEKLDDFRRHFLASLFRHLPLAALIIAILLGGLALGFVGGPGEYAAAGGIAVLLIGALCLIYRVGNRQARPAAEEVAKSLAEANRLYLACGKAAAAKHEHDRQAAQTEFDHVSAAIHKQWERADDVETDFQRTVRQRLETTVPRLYQRNAQQLLPKLRILETERKSWLDALRIASDEEKRHLAEVHATQSAELAADESARWEQLEQGWKQQIVPTYSAIAEMNAAVTSEFPAWESRFVESWAPQSRFTPFARFGELRVDLAKRPEILPKDARLALPGPAQLTLPLALNFPDQGSLFFETHDSGDSAVLGSINNVIFRLLTTTPPGKITFTIIDPVGLGQSFAGVMHLSDYEESLINHRIWTQRDQIEERLADLSSHIEKVIQMYLRNEYASITEYNEQAGSVAEKYHFLVVADFPAGFSEVAVKRLQSIAASGARCGIYTLIHLDQRQPAPDGVVAEDLRKNSVAIRQENGAFILGREQVEAGAELVLDPPPAPELAVELIHKIGKSSIDSNRVEVPFSQVAPKPEEMWKNETTNELRVAIGRTGATKLQQLAIGKGTRQHALFAGKTGSGKSTLFHVIITNLALACSPEQVEFYLVDFKKGVEFKCYAAKRLPHARVVAIESDREFALSVLQRVDDELKRRGDMFRKLGVQDLAGYKRAGGTEAVPRSLLIIDEFQEFFVEDDAVAQSASVLFDRIVRQGRAFGIHVLLGSQTLGGAYSLARSTLGQMVIRVALQCNEADAYLIMDDNNPAPRLLSRPGEGIYNDSAGAVEGNSPFQVVWLPDDERDLWLDRVHELAEQRHLHYPSPVVFEGNSPADISENDLLRAALDAEPSAAPVAARAWLGAPNSIKGPTEAVFHRQSGNHLLIVGQRDEAALTLLGVSLLSLAAQYPAGGARFVFLHSAPPGSSDAAFIEQIAASVPHQVTIARANEVAEAINTVATEMKERAAGDHPSVEPPPVFVFVHGLHKLKKLRHEDDFDFSLGGSDAGPNPGAQFNDLICEGSANGIHLLVTVDTFNNVNRAMNRKALSEFEMRVVFQMSANDSASLIDSPKASGLGLHRALFYNEQEGHLETFRPYALPDPEWLRAAGEVLARRRRVAQAVETQNSAEFEPVSPGSGI